MTSGGSATLRRGHRPLPWPLCRRPAPLRKNGGAGPGPRLFRPKASARCPYSRWALLPLPIATSAMSRDVRVSADLSQRRAHLRRTSSARLILPRPSIQRTGRGQSHVTSPTSRWRASRRARSLRDCRASAARQRLGAARPQLEHRRGYRMVAALHVDESQMDYFRAWSWIGWRRTRAPTRIHITPTPSSGISANQRHRLEPGPSRASTVHASGHYLRVN